MRLGVKRGEKVAKFQGRGKCYLYATLDANVNIGVCTNMKTERSLQSGTWYARWKTGLKRSRIEVNLDKKKAWVNLCTTAVSRVQEFDPKGIIPLFVPRYTHFCPKECTTPTIETQHLFFFLFFCGFLPWFLGA